MRIRACHFARPLIVLLAALSGCYRPTLIDCSSPCDGACPSPLRCIGGYCSSGRLCSREGGAAGDDGRITEAPDADTRGDAEDADTLTDAGTMDADAANGADGRDATAEPPDGGSTDADAGADAGAECPAGVPDGGSCAVEGLLCTYGARPRPDCRDRATCRSGAWVINPSTCVPPAGGCPTSPPTSQTACPGMLAAAFCVYTDVECLCGGTPETPGAWACYRPSPPAPCPAVVPNAGSPCDQSLACMYGCSPITLFSVNATCDGAVWGWFQRTCTSP